MSFTILIKKKVADSMNKRIDLIIGHLEYIRYQKLIDSYEHDRVFCKHDMLHAIDVARIFYIKVLEQGIDIKKDIAYAAALLHDIGRADEYKDSVPHHLASIIISEKILDECDYQPNEINLITNIISTHRDSLEKSSVNLLFFESDKNSRLCFQCSSNKKCKWQQDKKNHSVIY